jgi:hypothetical protein
LWNGQADGFKKVSCTECRQIDLGPLHSTGAGMTTTGFHIEILYQGHTGKESLTGLPAGEVFSNPAERFEQAVLALKRIGRFGGVLGHRLFQQGIDGRLMFFEKPFQATR